MVQRLNRTRLFRGFSSIDKTQPNTEIIDVELVKRDLLNHFYTSRGERVMRPTFGSVIWDLLFEPFDAVTREAIIADVEFIVSFDPRVDLLNIEVVEFEHGIRVSAELLYVPFNAIETFEVEFDRRNSIQGTSTQFVEEINT